jgi:ABC-type uncharacterized transport system substrate-binding protein
MSGELSAWIACNGPSSIFYTRRSISRQGRTVTIEYRWAEGRNERFAEIAGEFVRLKVDVIVTSGGAADAAKQTTSAIPIVFAPANDPVGADLVANLARPGGNITGLSQEATDTAGKRVELFREFVPSLRRMAIVANIGNRSNMLEINQSHRHGQPRSDSPRTPIPRCMAPNDDWGHVCA